jgi:hypothetical protein
VNVESGKTPADEFFALNPEQRCSVHFALCAHAFEKWASYVNTKGCVAYVESVAGTHQVVDGQLPADAFEAARKGEASQGIARRYREPITALQDADLVLPERVTFAYYAVYNLFRKYAQREDVDDWLIVNQALAAEEDGGALRGMLRDAIQTGKQQSPGTPSCEGLRRTGADERRLFQGRARCRW